MLKRIVIIIILLTLIVSPRIILGFRNEKIAQNAMSDGNYKRAAEEYELAADRLFWRDNLWESVGIMRSRTEEKKAAIIALEIAQHKNALSAPGWDLLGVQLWDLYRHEDANIVWQ